MMAEASSGANGAEALGPPFMAGEKSKPVNVPASEISRQATDALGGYVYQLDHTVMMWLSLGDEEALHVEFAEDVAKSDDGKLALTQIKKVIANITLRSEGVAKLITSVWEFQKTNPDRQVSGALLTTSGIGKEKKMSFPGKLPGLVYWRMAARAGADVEPIRTSLLSLSLPNDLKAFIKSATAEELRDCVVRPIRWLAKSVGQDELRQDAEDKLVLLGSRMGVSAAASKDARDFLVGALLDTLNKPAEQRYVTKAGLLEIFQKKTFISLPPNMLEGLPIPASGAPLTPVEAIARNVAQIPLPRRTAPRTKVVESLQIHLVLSGVLWFHGSSGLGKSILAVLLARSQNVEWRIADLRELSGPAIHSILVGLAGTFRQTGARGLVLDDIPADPDNALVSAIGQIARAVTDADGVLVITCTKPPHPTLSSRLGLSSDAIISVPYLTEEDVADMVRGAGGDAKKWARTIYAFAGGGHPQLVDARLAGLEQRGWEEKELLADFVPLPHIPNDMEEERRAVRNRLLGELQPNAMELLLRLSLLQGNFDRSMALVAADTPTAVAQAGLVFDFLVGPWIEQLGPERFRLSPLLKDSGAAGIARPVQRSIKTNVMNYLIEQRPFPADQLLQVFLIAFQQHDRTGLTWFGHAILSASANPERSQFKRLAQEVSVFALVDRGDDKPLIPDDNSLSMLLRLAQLRVAVATDDMKQAARLVNRALAENNYADAEQHQLLDATIFATVMLEPRIPIEPKRWLPMLLGLVATPALRSVLTLTQPLPAASLFSGLPPTATPDEMMFIARASALKSIEELAELIDALEQQPQAVRDRYLGAAARTNPSLHLIVAASWLTEAKRSGFDSKTAAATFHTLSETKSAKDNPDLAVELLCAEAIMLDEYGGEDKDGALEVLRVAQEAYPNNYRLNRQRQKVFYRHREYAEALVEFEKFQDRLPKELAVDRAFVMREAGRSAAEIGELEKARTFFEQAWESARVCGAGMKPMTAGLSADCAILAFDAGKQESALSLMHRALLEADDLDPCAGLKQAYVKRVHIAAVLYMQGGASDFPAARQVRVYGMCSDPEPQEWFRNQQQAQPAFVWYQLAELEAEISQSQAVLAELRRRTANGGLLPLESMLVVRLAEAAARNLDVDRFLEALKTYPRAIVEGVSSMRAWGGGDLFNMPVGNLTPISDGEWSNPKIAQTTKNAILSFVLVCAATGRVDIVANLRNKVRLVPALAKEVETLFSVIDEPSDNERDVYVIISSIAGRLLHGEVFNAEDVFLSAIYAFQFLEDSAIAPPAAEALMSFYERVWPEILRDRAFSMRGPVTNGPIILAAMRRGEAAMQRMANMVLAAEAASRRGLGHDLRERLSRAATKRLQQAQDA